jgi:GH24 family phage-related lysozyme (muramidase)
MENVLDYLRNTASGIGDTAFDQMKSFFGKDEELGGVAAMPTAEPKNRFERDMATSFIKDQESFVPTPFSDYKQMSIGYGTKAKKGDSTISEEEASIRLKDHMNKDVLPTLQKYVDPAVWDSLNVRQRSALMSLVYNIGSSAFKKSNALKALNAGDEALFIVEAFDKDKGFTKVTDPKTGKKVKSKGLIKRRADERRLWN